MPTLYVVRHAWAGDRDPTRWPDDAQRPLTEEGKKRFRRFARRLVERGVLPDYIATSPLVRCRQTAELLRKALPDRPSIFEQPSLAPGGDIEPLLAWSAHQGAAAAWVGHAPDVETILARLIGGQDAGIRFSKGAVAAIEFPAAFALGQGTLLWLLTAKMAGVE